MYRCDVCDSIVPPNTSSITIVVETRPREYPQRSKAHWIPPANGGKGKWIDDPGGAGTEIVRELRVCAPCAATRGHPAGDPARDGPDRHRAALAAAPPEVVAEANQDGGYEDRL